jgi:hypothetical protein
VERGIVCQKVDDVKTSESRRALHIDGEMMNVLKLWKQPTQFSANEDWIFASPVQSGRLPWSYDLVWRMYKKAGAKAGVGDSALTRCVTRIGHGLTLWELP